MSSETIYKAVRLEKEYRMEGLSVPVLKGLDLEIRRGEILAIVGRSGVGKSTLLHLLGLLDSPTGGQLLYLGRDEQFHGRDLGTLPLPQKARVRNRLFGFVFQFYHLLPDLNVIENVLLPAMIHRGWRAYRRERGRLHARAAELLDGVGLGERMEFPPTRLSGGERQRAAIARALMNDPELVFCDEPTGNLDTVTSRRIHELLLELNRRMGTGFVIVTHDPSLAALAQRVFAMRDGVLEPASAAFAAPPGDIAGHA